MASERRVWRVGDRVESTLRICGKVADRGGVVVNVTKKRVVVRWDEAPGSLGYAYTSNNSAHRLQPEGTSMSTDISLKDAMPIVKQSLVAQIAALTAKIQASRDRENRLRDALERIASEKPGEFDWPAEEWAKHTPETCDECKKWSDMKHPIQHSCDGWYRLFYERRKRQDQEREGFWYTLAGIARAALEAAKEGGNNGE